MSYDYSMTCDSKQQRGGYSSRSLHNSFLDRFMCHLSHTLILSTICHLFWDWQEALSFIMKSISKDRTRAAQPYHNEYVTSAPYRVGNNRQILHCSKACPHHSCVCYTGLLWRPCSETCCGQPVLWHQLVGIWQEAGQTSGATTNLEKSLI